MRMRFWKIDTRKWTVREVFGEPFPGEDEEGDSCLENTHFMSPCAAWINLYDKVISWVLMSRRNYESIKKDNRDPQDPAFQKAKKDLEEADKNFRKVLSAMTCRRSIDTRPSDRQI